MTVIDSTDALRSARGFLYPNYRQPDLVLTHGRGCWVWDEQGREYLDFAAGIAVNSLGHAHPAWVHAVSEQAGKLAHVSNYFYNAPNLRLAERLCSVTGMDRALFCNSGTEAVEASLKLARRYFFDRGEPERHRVVAFSNSFHGRTLGSLAATGQSSYRDGFGPLSVVTHVPFGDLSAVSATLGDDVAAILVEPIQGEGGVRPATREFLQGLRRLADESGCLLLADEIQTGIGRTGTFLALEHAGVRADVVAVAKGLGGGFPIGAMLCVEAYAQVLQPGSHGTTFGGNPLASRAALAVLETLEADGLVAAAAERGAQLETGLKALQTRFPQHVVDVRGRGLMQALELAPTVELGKMLEQLRANGLLLTAAGGSALRFTPPLIVSEADIVRAVDCLARALEQL